MENQETPEQARIRELEAKVYMLDQNAANLELINMKLGYSLRLMSEYHLTQDDKDNIANSIDMATKPDEVIEVYNQYKKLLHNDGLKDGMEDFQMSPDFKERLPHYLFAQFGEEPVSKLLDNIKIVKEYFDLENKIRSTPDAGQRNAMTTTLLNSRPATINAMNEIINSTNEINDSLNKENS